MSEPPSTTPPLAPPPSIDLSAGDDDFMIPIEKTMSSDDAPPSLTEPPPPQQETEAPVIEEDDEGESLSSADSDAGGRTRVTLTRWRRGVRIDIALPTAPAVGKEAARSPSLQADALIAATGTPCIVDAVELGCEKYGTSTLFENEGEETSAQPPATETEALPQAKEADSNAGPLLPSMITNRRDPMQAVIDDMVTRLNKQGLLADPRDVMRRGGGKGGEYYDYADDFFDDTEMLRELGIENEGSLGGLSSRSSESNEEVDFYTYVQDFRFDNLGHRDFDIPREEEGEELPDPASSSDYESDDDVPIQIFPDAWKEFERKLPKGASTKFIDLGRRLRGSSIPEEDQAELAFTWLTELCHDLRREHFHSLTHDPYTAKDLRLVEINLDEAEGLERSLLAMHPDFTEMEAKRLWLYPLMLHNQIAYDKLERSVFRAIITNESTFASEEPTFVAELRESVGRWKEVTEKRAVVPTPAAGVEESAQGTSPGQAAVSSRRKEKAECTISSSPFDAVGAEMLDWAMIYNSRKLDWKDLGESIEEWDSSFNGYAADKLSQCFAKRYGINLRLPRKYLEDTFRHLKGQFKVPTLCERRTRKISAPRLLTFEIPDSGTSRPLAKPKQPRLTSWSFQKT